jgi:agmatine deiminase
MTKKVQAAEPRAATVDTTATPRQLGYRMPAEWEPHRATWLSWPHEPTTWPHKLTHVEQCFARWIKALLQSGERVELNVRHTKHAAHVRRILNDWDLDWTLLRLHEIATNDVWIRDYGPIFVTRDGPEPLAIIDWDFDGWGGKAETYYGSAAGLDNEVPRRIADLLGLPRFVPGVVLEGGGIEVNGAGTLLAARECLLHMRSRGDAQAALEQKLADYLGVRHFIWLDNVSFEGDDTDGHIDNLARFVGPNRVVCVVTSDRGSNMYGPLQGARQALQAAHDQDGRPLEVIDLPLPQAFHYHWDPPGGKQRQRFPASYANFYIGNKVVLVPTYADPNDLPALRVIQDCFPTRQVIGIDCCDYILGQGAIHCSSQQEPAVVTDTSIAV